MMWDSIARGDLIGTFDFRRETLLNALASGDWTPLAAADPPIFAPFWKQKEEDQEWTL